MAEWYKIDFEVLVLKLMQLPCWPKLFGFYQIFADGIESIPIFDHERKIKIASCAVDPEFVDLLADDVASRCADDKKV